MDSVKIGEFLKVLRKSKGYTQEEVAKHLYVTQKTVSRWENGEGIPDINIITSVAEFYEITVDELLKGERNTKEQSGFTTKQKTKSRSKLVENQLLSKQNIYFIVSASVLCFFFMLGLLLGMFNFEVVSIVIIPFGIIIALAIYLYGNSEIKRILEDEDNIELKEDLEKARYSLKKKNILCSDIFFVTIILYILLVLIFYYLI